MIRTAAGHRWPLLVAVLATALVVVSAVPAPASAAANLVLTVTDSPDPAITSDTLAITATVRNESSAIAYDATVSFGAPTNATFSSAAGGCTEFVGVVVCSAGGPPPGDPEGDREFAPNASATFTVTYTRLEQGEVDVQLNASHADIVNDPPPNGVLSTTTVEPRADLKLDMSAITPVTIGNTSTVTATVTNSLPGPARETKLQLTVPLELPVASIPQGCTASALKVVCDLGTIAGQRTESRAITLRVPNEGSYILLGSVAWAKADPTPIDAQTQVTITGLSPIDPADNGPPPTTPTPKPALPKPQAVPISLITSGVPSGRRCVRGRTLRFKLRRPSGIPLTQADIYLGTRRVKRLTGASLTKSVVLRGLPRGRYTVIVVASLRDGGRLSGRRTLRACR